MTKRGKKENRRAKSKYPALNKGMNLNSRKDYIESDYVNGVYDDEGRQLIRPLNEDEKTWLNQFYEETVVTNFYHDPDLKRLNRFKKNIIEDDTVKALLKEVKELDVDRKGNAKRIKELKEIIKITKKQNEETYAQELEFLEEELQELREEKLLYSDKEDHKEFYNANNARNNCIFNKSRITNRLVGLDTDEYDHYLSKRLSGLDTEQIPIHDMEREMYEDYEERIEAILEDIRKIIRKKTKSLKK